MDKVNAGLEQIPKLLKKFRQQVLTQAVTGKLTENWREENKVSLEDWGNEKAADCCEKVQSGGTPREGFENKGIPFLKVYNIVDNKVAFDYRPQYVAEHINEKNLKKSITVPGDVLMNIVGPPLGKIAIVPDSHNRWNINQAITLFRPKSYLNNKYLYYFFCEGKVIRDVMPDTRGVVGQVNISLSQCRAFDIPIPSPKEQKEIVKRVDALFKVADTIERQYHTLQEKAAKLPQAILSKAFRGELVPQDPNDETATELLKRIQAMK